MIGANAVTTTEIADDSITTAKIGDTQVTVDKLASNSVTTGKIADNAVTKAKIDWTTIGWEAYTVTAPTGYTILENQCRINRSLGLFIVSLRLNLPQTGSGGTYASGLPVPAGNVSMPLFGRAEGGTLVNQNPGLWVRANGGTIGGANVTQAQVSGIQIGGIYPITPSN
jgi:hypothetical protein